MALRETRSGRNDAVETLCLAQIAPFHRSEVVTRLFPPSLGEDPALPNSGRKVHYDSYLSLTTTPEPLTRRDNLLTRAMPRNQPFRVDSSGIAKRSHTLGNP